MTKIFTKLKKYFYFTVDDTQLFVERAKKGDQKSVTKLFNKFKPILYSKIKNTTLVNLSKEEMEDEVLIFLGRIFTKELSKFDEGKASFGSWLTHCFNNHIISINRRKRRVYTIGTPRTCNQRIKRAMKRLNKKIDKKFFI